MALTSRERKILYLTVTAVVVFILNAYVLEPMLDKRAEAGKTCMELKAKVEQSQATLQRQKLLRRRCARCPRSRAWRWCRKAGWLS